RPAAASERAAAALRRAAPAAQRRGPTWSGAGAAGARSGGRGGRDRRQPNRADDDQAAQRRVLRRQTGGARNQPAGVGKHQIERLSVAVPLASILDVSNVGYPLLFLLVMGESSGVPIPGETALITAGVLASQGKLQIELVIVLAACAAIVGDNIGYAIARKGGRWLLERPGRFYRQRQEVLRGGEPVFSPDRPEGGV